MLIPSGDDGFDGFFLAGRSGNDGYFFETGEGEIERSGDRSSRKSEDIDPGTDFFDTLLVSDSELVFFIDDEESEFFVFHIF